MKPRLHVLFAGFGVALGLLGIGTWAGWRQFDRVETATALVAHTHQVLTRLGGLLTLVQDIETGARGFLVTGEPGFLEPYEAAHARMDDELRALCAFVDDDAGQRANCSELVPLVRKRMAIAQSTVNLRRTAGFDEAQKAVASGAGRIVMDQIRGLVSRMNADEQIRLEQRTAETKRAVRASNLRMTAGLGLALLLFIATFALVVRENILRQRSQAQLDRFFTLSLDMLCIAGTNGYFTRVSPSFTQTLGHSAEDLVTRPFLDFVHPEDRTATLAEMDKLRQGVPTIRFENRYRCKDGSYRWLAWKTQPDKSEGALYASARDVTHQKQAEEQIAQLNADLQRRAAELAEANRELESFSYSVSHDLRAPLRSIDGFSQVLLEDCADQLNDNGKDALNRVRKAATTMGELIDALLALSRVSRAELRAERVDLSALADTIAAELRESQPGRQVEFIIAPDLVVEADPRLLRAMLANLLGNAWKYTGQRGAARIEFGRTDKDGERVYFVRDNGVGFDMAYVGKLFGAFQRLHKQAEYAGTGVGLATVQRILHRHGGRAWAEAVPNEGATFYFLLHGRMQEGASV